MSQSNVERVIGRLVTDEAFRRRFKTDCVDALGELVDAGFDLTPCELRALACLVPERIAEFAESVDPRIQAADPQGDPA